MREKTAAEVYDEMIAEGMYRQADIDLDFIKKMYTLAVKNEEYLQFLLKQKMINWGVIYTLYYDTLRELCEALIMFDGKKISNHQGCFAYICIKFTNLDLDWNFFEKIRTTRNRNKYEGSEVAQQDWKGIAAQIKLYTSTIRRTIEAKLR